MSKTITVPEDGRHVHYVPLSEEPHGTFEAGRPHAAIIAHVHSERLVNLVVFDRNGNSFGKTSVPLQQPGEPEPQFSYARWMPYHLERKAELAAAGQTQHHPPAA